METLGIAIGLNGSLDLDFELKRRSSGSFIVETSAAAAAAAALLGTHEDDLARWEEEGSNQATPDRQSQRTKQRTNVLRDIIIFSEDTYAGVDKQRSE
jgi:hypothetical protein